LRISSSRFVAGLLDLLAKCAPLDLGHVGRAAG
jgi:hypothetical protein